MADAGIRLTVEGEKEFKAALAECDTAVKNNQKSLKLLTEEFKLNEAGMKDAQSGFGSMADAAEILASKGKVLADSIEIQTEKVGLLDARVEEASRTYGEHDKRTEALRAQLLDASTALTKLTAEQEKNRQAMLDAENSTKEYDDAVKALEAQLAANEAELKAMGGGLDALQKEYGETEKASGSLNTASGALEKGFGTLGSASGTLEKGFGTLGKSADELRTKEELVQKQEENLRKQNENLTAQNGKLTDSISKQKDLIDNLAKAQETASKRYGEGSKEAEGYRKKLADATGQLDAMERELRENEKAIQDNNAAIEDGGNAPNAMLDGLSKIEEMTGIKIPAGIKEMIGGFDGGTLAVGGIVGALGTVAEKMKEIMTDSMEWSKDITTRSAELDLNTEQYQELEYIALKTGASVSVFESALSKISTKAGEAALANDELTGKIEEQKAAMEEAQRAREMWSEMWQTSGDDAYLSQIDLATQRYQEAKAALEELESETDQAGNYFEDLGISIYDTNGDVKSSLDLFYELIDVYASMETGAKKDAKMKEVLGESYRQLNPYVQNGAEDMKKWAQEAHEAGYVIEEDVVGRLNQAGIEADLFKKRMDTATKELVIDITGIGKEAKGLSGILEDLWNNTPIGGFIRLLKGDDPLFKWVKKVGGFASGTNYAPGGLALVGERGPEIVDLPRGSKVYPSGVLPAGMGGGSTVNESNVFNITIDAASVEKFNDIVRIAQGARVGMRRG